MKNLALLVMGLRGRWPDVPGRFDGRKVEAEVVPEANGTFVIRLDPHDHPEAWLELHLKLLPND